MENGISDAQEGNFTKSPPKQGLYDTKPIMIEHVPCHAGQPCPLLYARIVLLIHAPESVQCESRQKLGTHLIRQLPKAITRVFYRPVMSPPCLHRPARASIMLPTCDIPSSCRKHIRYIDPPFTVSMLQRANRTSPHFSFATLRNASTAVATHLLPAPPPFPFSRYLPRLFPTVRHCRSLRLPSLASRSPLLLPSFRIRATWLPSMPPTTPTLPK